MVDMILLTIFGILSLCGSCVMFMQVSSGWTACIPATMFLLLGLGCIEAVVYTLIKTRR